MNLRHRLTVLLLAASTLPLSQVLFPGCATMMSGARQEVLVRSQPTGAQVFLNGRRIGATPATAYVSRWGFHRVRIEMPGYLPYEVKLEKGLNGNAAGNLYVGGVWIIVDVLTGAIFELKVPKVEHDAEWRKVAQPEFREFDFNGPVYVVAMLKPDPGARKIGQMQRK
jgi:hypothetical protein